MQKRHMLPVKVRPLLNGPPPKRVRCAKEIIVLPLLLPPPAITSRPLDTLTKSFARGAPPPPKLLAFQSYEKASTDAL